MWIEQQRPAQGEPRTGPREFSLLPIWPCGGVYYWTWRPGPARVVERDDGSATTDEETGETTRIPYGGRTASKVPVPGW
jgi:hypothetical protein